MNRELLNNTIESALDLLENEMMLAYEALDDALEDKADPARWRAYAAHYRRAQMISHNLNMGFAIPRPIVRVRADRAAC